MRVTSFKHPEAMVIEKNWNGKLLARFAENITESQIELEDGDITQYSYDEYIYEDEWSDKLARKIGDMREVYLAKAKENEQY